MDRVGIRQSGDKLTAALSRCPWVLAIFNNGSTVVGTDQLGSDVDFTIVIRRSSDLHRTLLRLKRPFDYLGMDHGTFSFRGRRNLGVTIIDRRRIESLLRRLYRSRRDFIELQGIVQHKVVEAVAVYDPKRLLPRYQRMASRYPRRIQREVCSAALESLKATYNSWGPRNEFHFFSGLPSILENVCLILYARNRRLFMLPFKRLHEDLRELSPNLTGELYQLMRGGRTARSRARSRRILRAIILKLAAPTR